MKHLKTLGSKVDGYASPEDAPLEVVPNKYSDFNYVARFTSPELTSICPVTGQPDFATIVIDYVPNLHLVESKSLKLFLSSFRNHGDFHESCTMYIAKRIIEAADPRWLRINAYWNPRGGIPIDVFFQTSEPPSNVWIEPIDIGVFRGR
jgi:7-cyano-7-deazaguanine reductase